MSLMESGDIAARLRDAGLRVTAARRGLLELLDATEEPLSHGEAVERLGALGGDPATCYRNLMKLVETGLARVASTVGGVTRFESASRIRHEHPHFHCDRCGVTSCLPETKVEAPRGRWKAAVKSADLTFVGQCPDCADARDSSR